MRHSPEWLFLATFGLVAPTASAQPVPSFPARAEKVHEAKAAVAAFVRALGEDDRILLVATGSGEGRLSPSGASRPAPPPAGR